MTKIKPTHPGEILREEFLLPMGISAYKLAKDLGVPTNRISSITNEIRDISPETALLLSKYFGLSDDLWINLQGHYDIECAKDIMKERLKNVPSVAYNQNSGTISYV
jgi:addiction module HigA family antidote